MRALHDHGPVVMGVNIMQQKTAIIKAIKLHYDATQVQFRRSGHIFTNYGGGRMMSVAYMPDVWTRDHNGHSTAVYERDRHIATVYGAVD